MVDVRKLLIAEAAGVGSVVGVYALTVGILWMMLHVPGYYGVWVDVMYYGYSFLLFDGISRFIQSKLGYGLASKKAALSVPTFLILGLLTVLPDSFKGLMLAGLNSWLFLPMVLSLTPGLAILGVVYYWKVFKKDIDDHNTAAVSEPGLSYDDIFQLQY